MAISTKTLFTSLFAFLALISESLAIRCGDYICTDSNVCCGDACCFHVWDVWWFWTIWVFVFLIMLVCASCCRQARAARARRQALLVVQGPPHPNQPYVVHGYGAVSNTECAPIIYAPSPLVNNGQQATGYTAPGQIPPGYGYSGAQMPPAYTPATKPPDYNAVANAPRPPPTS